MSNLVRLKKHNTKLFLNVGEGAADWARIGKSTIFDLTYNANVVTSDFIEDEMPTDDVTYYKPTLSQELQTNKGDEAFDYMYDMAYELPTGEDIKKDVLIIFAGNIGSESAPKFNAWKCGSSLVLTDLNTVDEKIMFDININTITRGTATIDSETKKPTFEAN